MKNRFRSSTEIDIRSCLIDLYGESTATPVFVRVRSLVDKYLLQLEELKNRPDFNPEQRLDQRDSILITYGDQLQDSHLLPLQVLAKFCRQHVSDFISGVHILPFFPFSSDDGFSVIDYRRVNPDLGSWEDVTQLGRFFRLMFDLVINHVSAKSDWFQGFLRVDPRYEDYFIIVDDAPDLSEVVRPRTSPLLTDFETASGRKAVWTTFSADQIDLNYQNPDVLLEMIDTLLFYVSQGTDFIRLDAIAYLWKEIGTPCLHHPKTHRIVQLLRLILDRVAPWIFLITETNVPHAANISYLGDGENEAQLVYNFALPPLVLHTLHTGDCSALASWVGSLSLPSDRTTFFNFLASHDGIGINPVRGILSDEEIQALVDKTVAHGGLVSSNSNPDGASSPYELNINYFDALSDPNGDEPEEIQIDRFICSQAIMLSMVGVPGIYFHSLFGSRGWPEGVEKTGQNRAINRQKLERDALEAELSNPNSRRSRVFRRYEQLLRARSSSPAFDPYGSQRVLDCGSAVLALIREGKAERDGNQKVLCLHNVTTYPQFIGLKTCDLKAEIDSQTRLTDMFECQMIPSSSRIEISLRPYQSIWIAY